MTDAQMLDVMNRHQRLFESEENRDFAEKKVELLALEQEQKLLLFKEKIETEDFEKNIKWLKDKTTEK